MTTTVTRPDLSARKTLNKSILGDFDRCQTRTWFSIHDPQPFIPKEQVTFGSALDAGVEVIVKYAGSGQQPDLDVATDAAAFVIERDDQRAAELGVEPTGVDITEVQSALATFVVNVLPTRDWTGAITQYTARTVIDGLGECDGHPDIVVGTSVLDVKGTTAKSPKDARSLEMGFYTILLEAEGRTVTEVGYLEYRRGEPHGALKTPKWLTPTFAVTDEFRRWAWEQSAAFVRAKRADELLNSKAPTPQNYSFPGGPKWSSMCADCPWGPAFTGKCAIAYREEAA